MSRSPILGRQDCYGCLGAFNEVSIMPYAESEKYVEFRASFLKDKRLSHRIACAVSYCVSSFGYPLILCRYTDIAL